ncbi:LINE-1 retrotransposable element ORF2 protein [Cucumis melo var. makuwa]|uniref:LINE-1 retrotransposable element ORF2 protein n=1 Tax=Cucumis melo var. makuwa TaxID=1194695 RepID=A0A5A7UP78_CUCMM|nr:LINE-1 retrotransposable element ORF2 protein [Cucumis melo var. makuwa]TYJ99411.1 LINE-1 retrotransposable element ORF2 protein [Cucumis melo var. makuwa]
MNNTYIALIVKRKDYSVPKDFRPISLTTSIYKIIAKTLANRLKLSLPDTISGNQLTFVKNRQITYAILMANEAIDYWKVKKTKGFILKLDIEKAFNKLNWDFIDFMLEKKNYPSSWRNWIRGCIGNINYLIINNGRPQGRINVIKGVSFNNECSLSHILFADDILLFVEDKDCYIKNLQMTLSLFEKASGLKINLAKQSFVL